VHQAEKKPEPQPEPQAQPETPPPTTQTLTAQTLINRSLAMASLSAEIDRRLQAYAKRPKRKWITARTKEHKYAAYMEAWRQKVERVGNLNYPDEARRANLSGNLLLDVALRPDGSVQEIILRRSSGKKVLDDAAIRIVNLAAPFARFPKGIAEETDILHVERTWQFLSGNRFSSR
jgi:protein TonB